MPELSTERASITPGQMRYAAKLIRDHVGGPVCTRHAELGLLFEEEVRDHEGQPLDYALEWWSQRRASEAIDTLNGRRPRPMLTVTVAPEAWSASAVSAPMLRRLAREVGMPQHAIADMQRDDLKVWTLSVSNGQSRLDPDDEWLRRFAERQLHRIEIGQRGLTSAA